jgi:predicted Zn-ribbon and HTH transcriptional regulator
MWRHLFNLVTALSLALWLAALATWLWVPLRREYSVHAGGHRWTVRPTGAWVLFDVSEGRWEPDGQWGPPAGKVYRLPVGRHHFLPLGVGGYERSNPADPRQVAETSVVVAQWSLQTLLSLLPLAWVARLLVRRRRAARLRQAPLCPACGYDLRATPVRCPECGTERPAPEAAGRP